MRRLVRTAPGKILAGQAAVTCAAALLALVTLGAQAAIGALAGGGISLALTAWTAARAFAVGPEAGPEAMLSAFARAEAMKIVMAVVLFSAAAIFLSHVYVPLVMTFVATLIVNWAALLFTRRDPAGLSG